MNALAAPQLATPSITTFRERVAAELEGADRDVVVLAIDGIPYSVARRAWPQAATEPMRSVFPTTSSAGWLSALTGTPPERHGVPGVFFTLPGCATPLGVFDHRLELDVPAVGNVFGDAAALGYEPLSIVGDLAPYDCSWRDVLLNGARRVAGPRFYTAISGDCAPPAARGLADAVAGAIAAALTPPGPRRRFVWCFVETDGHVHRFGYDDHAWEFLAAVDEVAARIAEGGATVLAHSDHGLTRTVHDPDLELLIAELGRRGMAAGGAGRTRWLYCDPSEVRAVAAEVTGRVPEDVRVAYADDYFAPGSLGHERVGAVLLIAEGERFVTSPGYRFDHGSLTEVEVEVPFSRWGA